MEAFYTIEFQRSLIKLICLNIKFSIEYGPLIKREYFETEPLRILFDMSAKYVLSYSKEIEKEDLLVLIDEFMMSRGLDTTVTNLLIEECGLIYRAPLKSEQFIIDKTIQFCRRQEMKSALVKCVTILEEDGDYDNVLKVINGAVAIGCGDSDGIDFNSLYNLPLEYRKKYDPDKLVKTGIPSFDRALMGGMAPGELHCFIGSTRITLLDGTSPTMEELCASGRQEFWLYACKPDGEVVPARGHSARVTGHRTDLIEVTLDNNEKFTCTPDHLQMMRDGSWRKTEDLVSGDYLMSGVPLVGSYVVISPIRHVHYTTPIPVYDITVDVHHNFTLKAGTVTHNCIQAPPKCLTGDTLVQLLDETEIPISEFENRGPTWVLSYDIKSKKIVPAQAVFSGKRMADDVVEVELDNGFRVKCTSDHPWLLSSGEYVKAIDLKTDDSLMASYWGKRKATRPCVKVTTAGRGERLQDIVARYKVGSKALLGKEIHHSDGNPLNNNPDNLRVLTKEGHSRIHGKNPDRLQKMWDAAKKFRDSERGDVWRSETRERLIARNKMRSSLENKGQNHRVVAVRPIGSVEVFDISVPGPNNFSISAGIGVSRNGKPVKTGVFVHNSGKSTLATNIGTSVLATGKVVYHASLEIKAIDVAIKYAARMTGLTYQEIVDSLDDDSDYVKLIHKFTKYNPKLYINYWTEKTVNVLAIRSWISKMRSKTGHNPSMIIVDYDDCLLPIGGSTGDMYEDAGMIYSDLIGLADYFQAVVITFAQPKRDAWSIPNRGELIHADMLAHSAKKAHKAYSISSMNFADGAEVGILYADMLRRGESGVKVNLQRDLSRGLIREVSAESVIKLRKKKRDDAEEKREEAKRDIIEERRAKEEPPEPPKEISQEPPPESSDASEEVVDKPKPKRKPRKGNASDERDAEN